MAEVGVFGALGYVLDYVAGIYSVSLFPNGGSIGVALVCVFLVAYRRGVLPGMLVGLIISLLDMAGGFFSIADVWYKVFGQLALDYWLAYPLAALAGVMRGQVRRAKNRTQMGIYLAIGCFIGGFLKFAAHYLSGILFWPGDPWNVGGSYIYSALYNGAYMLPSVILSGLIIVLIGLRWPAIFTNPDDLVFVKAKKDDGITKPGKSK